MRPTDDLTRALALQNPVLERDVRAVTGRDHRELSRSWTDGSEAPGAAAVTGAVHPAPADIAGPGRSRQAVVVRPSLPGRRTGLALLAACVAGLVAATGVVGTGGVQAVRDRLTVAGMPDVPDPDRAAEQQRLASWERAVVDCVVAEYDPWVTAADGGYVYDVDARFAEGGPDTEPVDDLACRRQAGPHPRPSPLTPDEARVHLADLRGTAQCLQGLGLEVPEPPPLREFYVSFQETVPSSPPWTPFALVPDDELVDATQRCGSPAPPAPPTWQTVVADSLNRTYSPRPVPGTAAVAFTGVADQVLAIVPCMAALGIPIRIVDDGVVLTDGGPQEEEVREASAVCNDRYPVHPRHLRPLEPDQLSRLYDWYVQESVPCLQGQGVSVEPAPPRADFIRDYPMSWHPHSSVQMEPLRRTGADGASVQGTAEWELLRQACPELPPDRLLTGDG